MNVSVFMCLLVLSEYGSYVGWYEFIGILCFYSVLRCGCVVGLESWNVMFEYELL